MGKIKIAMLEEGDYVSGFAAYVGQHGENWMELHCFTDVKNLEVYMSGSQIDVLLIGENYMCNFHSFGQIKKIIMLSENVDVCESVKYTVFFKYQSAERILRDVCGEIASGEGFPAASIGVNVCDKEFIGVYSPWGGCASSLYAQNCCKRNKTNKKVLYVNFQLLSTMYFQDREKRNATVKKFGMSELIYYLRQGKENAALKLRSIVRDYKGIDSIYPVEDYRDLYGMTKEDVEILFSLLSNESMYDVIVLDIGFLSEISLILMQQCDSIYMAEASCEMEKDCIKSFNNLLLKEGLEGLNSKCVTVKMAIGGEAV